MNDKKFLTEEQEKELKANDWKVNSKGAYLTLYQSDYEYLENWRQICEQLEVSPQSLSVDVLYFGIKKDNNL